MLELSCWSFCNYPGEKILSPLASQANFEETSRGRVPSDQQSNCPKINSLIPTFTASRSSFKRSMMMEVSSLLSLPDGIEIASVSGTSDLLTIHVVATAPMRACPLCAEAATHVRSYYTRLVADLPCAGRRVQLLLHVRKFRCDTVACPRKVFAERLGTFLQAWARKTTRLRQAIEAIGLATCGEGGARLADRLAIATSPTTILRRIMALPLPPVETVTHLGIDDFALRRGRTYGTVLVDLRLHKVIDLLPDRKAETAKAWMQARPEIELVSRDRGGDYAAAARQGAPQAIQTADRFHLCKNLTEAV